MALGHGAKARCRRVGVRRAVAFARLNVAYSLIASSDCLYVGLLAQCWLCSMCSRAAAAMLYGWSVGRVRFILAVPLCGRAAAIDWKLVRGRLELHAWARSVGDDELGAAVGGQYNRRVFDVGKHMRIAYAHRAMADV